MNMVEKGISKILSALGRKLQNLTSVAFLWQLNFL